METSFHEGSRKGIWIPAIFWIPWIFGIFQIYRRRRSVAPYTANEEKRSSVILHNTFGQVMTDSSTESYFKQLEDSWNA